MGFESWLERDELIRLDFDLTVTGIASQPFWLYWTDKDGVRVSHAPDYFVRKAHGAPVVIDCRPVERRPPRDVAKFDTTAHACKLVGWEYRLVCAGDPVMKSNLPWLSGYRLPRYRVPGTVAALHEAVDIAALVASPAWRRLAAGDTGQQQSFITEIGVRLGRPDDQPPEGGDAIAHWMKHDSWRPPSRPHKTYPQTSEHGSTRLRQASPQTRDRHDRSANVVQHQPPRRHRRPAPPPHPARADPRLVPADGRHHCHHLAKPADEPSRRGQQRCDSDPATQHRLLTQRGRRLLRSDHRPRPMG